MSIAKRRRQHIDIVVAWINGMLHRNRAFGTRHVPDELLGMSRTYSKLTSAYAIRYDEVLEKHNGTTELDFDVTERIKYYRSKALDLAQEADDVVIRDDTPDRLLKRGDLVEPVSKDKFDAALHAVGTLTDGEWKNVLVYDNAVDRTQLPPLPVYTLQEHEYAALDEYLNAIGEMYWAQQDALKHIQDELRGPDPFKARPKTKVAATVPKLADQLIDEHWDEVGDDGEWARIAKRASKQYRVEERPDYRFNDQGLYDALRSALRRRVEKKSG